MFKQAHVLPVHLSDDLGGTEGRDGVLLLHLLQHLLLFLHALWCFQAVSWHCSQVALDFGLRADVFGHDAL